jgi:predicted DNA-binding transcriptional regulator YafY
VHHTIRETTEQTLTRLITAMDRRTPVTITYIKADDTTTVRTIEIYDFLVTQAGDIVIKAMDRETGESRTFRLDRVTAYTVHRSATYAVIRDEPQDEKSAAAPTLCQPRMDTVADLDVAGTSPVDLLAFALAA